MPWDGASIPSLVWRTAAYDPAVSARLAARFDLPEPVAALLAARGLTDEAAVPAFLAPHPQNLSDPLHLPGMESARQRIGAAIRRQQPIVVFGDFDADGVVAAALLTSVIRALGGTVRTFLPERLREGYGLTALAVARCLGEGAPALLITVDCGMGAEREIAAFQAAGVEVIVTDHHQPTGRLPEACVVVNPRLPGVPPAAAHLCGAGVAFKLAHALLLLARQEGWPGHERLDLRDWLDAVALATVADVVPLRGDNRILVAEGLKRLDRRPRTGLKALMSRAGIAPPLSSHHLGFVLGPRINAAGRMRSAGTALELLTTDDADCALARAVELEQLNVERRQVEQQTLVQAQEQLAGWFREGEHGAVVAGGAGWHQGTLGIVAARLCERFRLPAAVVALDGDGGGRGSVRAGHAHDAMAVLAACEPLLLRYGGHARAGGFSLKPGAFLPFRDSFTACCRQPDGAAAPPLMIDAWIDAGQIDWEFWTALQRLEPFGEGHPRPRWGLRGQHLGDVPRQVGREGEHLRLRLAAADGGERDAVWFRGASRLAALQAHTGRFDVALEVQAGNFNGRETLDLHVVDMRPEEPAETPPP